MDRFIGGFVGSNTCFVYDYPGGNRIHGLYHQVKNGELQFIMQELNNPLFSAWKVACSTAGISAGKLFVVTNSGRGSVLMVYHAIGPFA